MNGDEEAREIIRRYEERLEGNIQSDEFSYNVISREYEIFRREALEKHITFYEQLCNTSEKILKIKPSDKDREKLIKSIETAHLNITPEGAASFAAVASIFVILLGILVGGISYFLGSIFLFTTLLLFIAGAVLIKPLTHIPNYLANRWRLEASNQMVLCILYIVIYMRHTSNLEHAIKFAAEHIGPPLSLDFKKVFWDVETQKFFTIKESLDYYLKSWRDYNLEFIEAFHLVEGSLYEPSEQRRIEMLEKALQVMLEGTYDKMLHYAHNLKSPITILHMLGIILPILGLVLFPLIGSFMSGLVKWYHLAMLYNVILPIVVFTMGNNILVKRPTGYGEGDITKISPGYKEYQTINGMDPFYIAFFIGFVFVVISLIPFITHYVDPSYDFNFIAGKFFDFKDFGGPYGIGALLLSLLLPFGIALGMSFYYKIKSRKLIEVIKQNDNLEKEFSGALFQLGNRIGDGLPAEIAFGKVAESTAGTESGKFFAYVNENIRNAGMGLKEAIFDNRRGALLYFPSRLIESSMKVLIESSKKGPSVASKSLITISTYIDRIKQVNERLKDLLADILSGMTSQINFLTPAIAGIVVGVGSMVVTIINKLSEQFADIGGAEGAQLGGIAGIANILRIQDVIPSFQFQAVVGIYVLEITIILTILSTQIERGIDRVTTSHRLGKNLLTAVGLYTLISLIGIIVFNFMANAVSVVGTGPAG